MIRPDIVVKPPSKAQVSGGQRLENRDDPREGNWFLERDLDKEGLFAGGGVFAEATKGLGTGPLCNTDGGVWLRGYCLGVGRKRAAKPYLQR